VTGGFLLEGSGRGSRRGGSGQLVLCLPQGRDGVGERGELFEELDQWL
jgi:hypothetical protein